MAETEAVGKMLFKSFDGKNFSSKAMRDIHESIYAYRTIGGDVINQMAPEYAKFAKQSAILGGTFVGGGALVGAAIDDEHPIRGAIAGAAIGGIGTYFPSKAIVDKIGADKILRDREKIMRIAGKIASGAKL